MLNILSHLGVTLQSEVCMWTMLGLLRSTFDATLFRVNANLKEVWLMSMPEELAMPVQRALRTAISGVVLVQCFSVHLYLASYIILLYPVFLEERPALVLPWLLVSAVRWLLCELCGLTLGLAVCVLIGATRTPCICFVLAKCATITPALYMWILVFSYYQSLKISAAFKMFPAVSSGSDPDYGLEQAIRRRRTKSLFGEPQLRKNLATHFYAEQIVSMSQPDPEKDTKIVTYNSRIARGTSTLRKPSSEELTQNLGLSTSESPEKSEYVLFDEWFATVLHSRSDGDRILDQFVLMMLRVAAFLATKSEPDEGTSLTDLCLPLNVNTQLTSCPDKESRVERFSGSLPGDDADTPSHVGSEGHEGQGYLREFPLIFKKRRSDVPLLRLNSDDRVHINPETHQNISSLFSAEMRRNESVQTDTLVTREGSVRSMNNRADSRNSEPNLSRKDESNKK